MARSITEIENDIRRYNSELSGYTIFYTNIKELYENKIIAVKQAAENLYNEFSDNYTGSNESVYQAVGNINGQLYGVQLNTSTLITKVESTMVYLKKKIDSLKTELTSAQNEAQS